MQSDEICCRLYILCTALKVFMASKGKFANSCWVEGSAEEDFISWKLIPKVLVPSSTFVCMRLYLKWSDGGVVESWSLPESPSVAFVPIPPWFHHLRYPPSTSNGRHQPNYYIHCRQKQRVTKSSVCHNSPSIQYTQCRPNSYHNTESYNILNHWKSYLNLVIAPSPVWYCVPN